MRTLNANQQALAAASNQEAVPVLKVEWGGAVGDKYYTDGDTSIGEISLLGRVLRWGDASSQLQQTSNAPTGTYTLTLAIDGDDGHNVVDAIQAQGAADHRATLYTAWRGELSSEWVARWQGVTMPDVAVDHVKGTVTLRCHDIGADSRRPIGAIVSRSLFAYCAEEAEGRVTPIVYGNVHRVPALFVRGGGPKATLTTFFDWNDTTFRVNKPDEFGAGTIQVWVDDERMEGSFSGNLFTVSDRPIDIQIGLTIKYIGDGNPYSLKIVGFTGNAREYLGQCLAMRVKNDAGTKVGSMQYRKIMRWVTNGADTDILLAQPFSAPGDKGADDIVPFIVPWALPGAYHVYHPGDTTTQFDGSVTTQVARHFRGGEVRRASPDGEYIFICAKGACEAIDRVYCRTNGSEYMMLPSDFYQEDSADSQFNSEVGGDCATLTFQCPPSLLPYLAFEPTDEIYADIKGPGAAGTPYTNPATVIDELAQAEGIASADIDSAAIAAAETARTNWAVAFAITESKSLAAVLSEIAYQTFMAIDWTAGLRLVMLDNSFTTATAVSYTFDKDTIISDSLRVQKSDTTQLTTEVTVSWAPDVGPKIDPLLPMQRLYTERDPNADPPMVRYGLKKLAVDGWVHKNIAPVKTLAYELLFRYRYGREVLVVPAFHDAIALQVGDLIGIDLSATGINIRGWIRKVTFHPGRDNTAYEVEVPPTEWYQTHNPPSPSFSDAPDPHADELAQDNLQYYLPWPAPSVPAAPSGTGNTGSVRAATIQTDNGNGTYDVLDDRGDAHAGIEIYTMQGVNAFEGNGAFGSNKHVVIAELTVSLDWYIIAHRVIRID